MVKLSSLKNKPDNRQVRAVIETPTGSVVVYEPTRKDIAEVLELQDMITAFNSELESDVFEISGQTIMRELIPLLTDIEIGDMSDEEIQDTIDNPSLAMLQVNHILQGIVSDIYKNMILSTINQIKNSDVETLVEDLQGVVTSSTLTNATRTEQGKELATKVVEESKKAEIAKANEEIKEMVEQMKVDNQLEEEKAIEEIVNDDNQMSYVDAMAARTSAHFFDVDSEDENKEEK